MDLKLWYKVEKESGFAVDKEGNPTEVYISCEINVDQEEISKEKYAELAEGFRNMVVSKYDIDDKYVVHITEEEYMKMINISER